MIRFWITTALMLACCLLVLDSHMRLRDAEARRNRALQSLSEWVKQVRAADSAHQEEQDRINQARDSVNVTIKLSSCVNKECPEWIRIK